MPISKVTSQSLNVRALDALRQNAAVASAQSPARQPDSVSLSDSALSLSRASKAVSEAPDVREARVAELKAAIASGTYSVDSRSLARSILREDAIS
jgi:negative regulator of flagellin synthesis FlgM